MRISGIYKIQSGIKPERCYIGSAVNIASRWRVHLCQLRKYKHGSIKLQRHYNKYNESDLQFSILIGCEREDLLKHEQFFIDSLNPYFNTCKVAGSSLGVKRSEEYKRNSSESRKGKKQSAETIRKRTACQKGRKMPEETRLKLIIANTGKKKSIDSINKSRETAIKLWQNPEYRKKTTEPHFGVKQSSETINKRRLKIFKSILQLDENGNVIKEWDSIVETRKFGFNTGHVSSCCSGKRNTTGGFKWKYKKCA